MQVLAPTMFLIGIRNSARAVVDVLSVTESEEAYGSLLPSAALSCDWFSNIAGAFPIARTPP